jgi:hypothetical protein
MSRFSQYARIAACGIFIMHVIGCDKVTKPSSDSTPPTLTWRIENQSAGTDQSIVGNGTVAAKPNETLRITLKSDDPEGVSYIELGGGYVVNCQGSGVASNNSGGYGKDIQNLSPDTDNKVLTKIILVKTITPDTACPGGTSFVKTTVSLNGVGRNYFSGQTNAALGVNVAP